MTFDQYITNPMGKNNAVLAGYTREAIRADYTRRFNNILLRENGKIDYFLYKDEKNNFYYILVKVPSEVVKNFYYDVVIKFYADSSIKENGRNLSKYYVEFFSNDPAFVFTYAHTFIQNGLFIKELSSKMSKEAIKLKAKEKNPHNINGYVKSIYFAYLFIKERGLFNPLHFTKTESFSIGSILNQIEDADSKILRRQEEGKKVDKRKKINVDKNTLRNISKIGISDQSRERLVTTTKRTKSVTKTTPKNSTKTVKTTKRK